MYESFQFADVQQISWSTPPGAWGTQKAWHSECLTGDFADLQWVNFSIRFWSMLGFPFHTFWFAVSCFHSNFGGKHLIRFRYLDPHSNRWIITSQTTLQTALYQQKMKCFVNNLLWLCKKGTKSGSEKLDKRYFCRSSDCQCGQLLWEASSLNPQQDDTSFWYSRLCNVTIILQAPFSSSSSVYRISLEYPISFKC